MQFSIPLEDGKLEVMLEGIDLYRIQETRDALYNSLILKYTKEGFNEMPVDEADWKKYVDGFEDANVRKAIEEEKPQNVAQMLAKKYANIRLIQEIIPSHLKTLDGELIVTTDEEKERFRRIVASDQELITLLTAKFGELFKKIRGVADEAKN